MQKNRLPLKYWPVLLFILLFSVPFDAFTKEHSYLKLQWDEQAIVLQAEIFPDISFDQLEKEVKKGMEYTIQWQIFLIQKNPKWYIPNKTLWQTSFSRRLTYNRWNQVFLVREKKQRIAFLSFRSAWNFMREWNQKVFVSLQQSNPVYATMSVSGSGLSLFWPLNVIYRNWISKLDFYIDKLHSNVISIKN